MKMPKVIRIAKWVGIVLLTLIISASALIYAYEDEVKAFALSKIESQLATRMNVAKVDLTLWEKFPLAAVKLNDVWIEESLVEGDTLLFAEEVFLAFNPISFAQGNYVVKRVDVQNADVRLRQEKEGVDNFHFWKAGEDSTGSFSFNISETHFKDAKVRYIHLSSDVDIDVYAERLDLSGSFSAERSNLIAEGSILSNHLHLNALKGAVNEEISLRTELIIAENASNIGIKNTSLNFDGIDLFWDGNVFLSDAEPVVLDGTFKLNKTGVAAVDRVFPQLLSDVLINYDLDAAVDAEGSLIGSAGNGLIPEIDAHLSVVNGVFRHKQSGEKLTDVDANARLVVYEDASWSVKANRAEAEFRSGEFSVEGYIENRGVPFLDAKVDGHADLEEIRSFFALDTLEIFQGDLELEASWKGSLPGWKVNTSVLNDIALVGQAEIDGAKIKVKGNPHTIKDLYANLSLNGQKVEIKEIKGMLGRSDFLISGEMKNFLPFLTNANEDLLMDVGLHSEHIYFEDLLMEQNEVEGNDKESTELHIPEKLKANFNLVVEEFEYNEFKATDVKGIAQLSEGYLRIKPLSFNTAEGELLADLAVSPGFGGNYKVVCEAKLQQMDISEVFRSFNDFGQKEITHRHLQGKATADLSFSADLSKEMRLLPESIYSLIDISIEEGELIGLESLTGISDYLRNNKLISGFVEADEFDRKLRHVRFNKLSNQVEIKDKQIIFPMMEISSSAMDISASGSHSFNNDIDYSIVFRIRDVLKKKRSDFGEVEDDGLGSRFFLAMKGTTDNPNFSFDKDARKAQRREDINEEKKVFKNLLKEEFGLFKGDDSLKEDEPKEKKEVLDEEPKITVEWGEADTARTEKKEDKPKKKRSILDRLKGDEDEEYVKPPEPDDDDF